MSNSSTEKPTKGSGERTDNARCFSWIKRNGEKLQISTPELLQHSDVASSTFLNFVPILGPARQGKSFLMNCLMGESVFDTADTIDACTKGVHIASVKHQVENGGYFFFVDTEGQGDKDVGSDITLLTPVLLLSKVILFNWKGGVQKNQILNELAILAKAANCVSSKCFKDNKSTFGHLNIVLRDFHFKGTAEQVRAKIFDEETGQEKHVHERNMLRRNLLASFESISVSKFPAPGENLQDCDPNTTSKKFKECVESLKSKIAVQASQTRKFGKIIVNSQNVDVLIRKFVQSLEEDGIVHLKSAVSQYEREVIDEAKQRFEESLRNAYKEVVVPVRDGLEKQLTEKKDALLDTFRKSTDNSYLAAAYRDEVLQNLKKFAEGEIETKKRENQHVMEMNQLRQERQEEQELLRGHVTVLQQAREQMEALTREQTKMTIQNGIQSCLQVLTQALVQGGPPVLRQALVQEQAQAQFEELDVFDNSPQVVFLHLSDSDSSSTD